MLKIEDLVVQYSGTLALRALSLEVNRGEVVGLIGPNGAGKTTTLRAICGLVRPASGSIVFEGRSVVGQDPENIVRGGIALIPEDRHVFGTLSVAENLQLGGIAQTDKADFKSGLDWIFERFPVLKHYYHAPAGRLSGGEQQQLAIARAIVSKARLLLLDEPSLGLAPLVVDLVFDVLAELRERGMTVLLVEQNAARTVEFADRTYLLRTGTISLSGTRDELRGKVDFAHAYLGV